MNKEAINKYITIAEKAAVTAGKYLSTNRGNVLVESQRGKDIKLSVDRGAERLIVDALREETDFAILSEETGLLKGGGRDGESDSLRWIVDPLDGSLNFYHGIPICCVSIALWEGNRPVPVNGEVMDAVENLKGGDVLLLENTRFYKEEKENDKTFARKLAELADLYVNDAFATAHRAHASTEGVARFLPGVAGLLMNREIQALESVLQSPRNPFAAIFGGAKVSDKIEVIGRLLNTLDALLIGGGMGVTFLKAKGLEVGDSGFEADHLETAQSIMDRAGKRLSLPVDVRIAEAIDENADRKSVDVENVPTGWHIADIGPKTVQQFKEKLQSACLAYEHMACRADILIGLNLEPLLLHPFRP
ncbi:MAG: phosphoglycerate kinase [Desulfatiglandaceae bacterium]